MACSCGGSCSDCRKRGGHIRKRQMKRGGHIRKRQFGGLLQGKSHKQGGIPAIIGGQEPVELEGGEYIVRKSSVDKYGEGTIARINQGLVDPAKLRQLKKGGPVGRKPNMRKGGPARKPNMRKGGPARRKLQRGGGTCPPGQHMMPDGTCMQGAYHGAPGTPGYQKGGPAGRKLQRGGGMAQQSSKWVYFGTQDSYHGQVIEGNGIYWTTNGGTLEGDRRQVELKT